METSHRSHALPERPGQSSLWLCRSSFELPRRCRKKGRTRCSRTCVVRVCVCGFVSQQIHIRVVILLTTKQFFGQQKNAHGIFVNCGTHFTVTRVWGNRREATVNNVSFLPGDAPLNTSRRQQVNPARTASRELGVGRRHGRRAPNDSSYERRIDYAIGAFYQKIGSWSKRTLSRQEHRRVLLVVG